jgi:hypothetical protein
MTIVCTRVLTVEKEEMKNLRNVRYGKGEWKINS